MLDLFWRFHWNGKKKRTPTNESVRNPDDDDDDSDDVTVTLTELGKIVNPGEWQLNGNKRECLSRECQALAFRRCWITACFLRLGDLPDACPASRSERAAFQKPISMLSFKYLAPIISASLISRTSLVMLVVGIGKRLGQFALEHTGGNVIRWSDLVSVSSPCPACWWYCSVLGCGCADKTFVHDLRTCICSHKHGQSKTTLLLLANWANNTIEMSSGANKGHHTLLPGNMSKRSEGVVLKGVRGQVDIFVRIFNRVTSSP